MNGSRLNGKMKTKEVTQKAVIKADKLNAVELQKDFPVFNRKIGSNKLVYLDNAATSQKPVSVINATGDFYKNHNANVHRGIHTLSEEATEMYEDARKKVAAFIGAVRPEEVIFTSGTTESLNMVALSYGVEVLKKGDVILTTDLEHHSNLVPWQIAAKITGAELDFVNVVNENTDELFSLFKEKLTERVKIVAITHASNVTGTILPVKEICKVAKRVGAVVVVDGAQAVPHMKVNVQSLGCDFYAFSGHKMLGPTGIGVLWAREELLKNMEPYKYGGGMIDTVELRNSTWQEGPEKFEGGTPNIEGVIGLAAAIDYLEKIGMENIRAHEMELTEYAMEKLVMIEDLYILGPKDAKYRTGLVSFVMEGIHAHDIASVLNSVGVAVRSGHHCAMPYHTKLNINASVRASFYLYNTKSDIDMLVEGLYKTKEILG